MRCAKPIDSLHRPRTNEAECVARRRATFRLNLVHSLAMKCRHFLLAIALLCILPVRLRAADPEQTAKSITIYRDNYGVPHVFAPTDAGCVFGYIYAQPKDTFCQIKTNYLLSLDR